MPAGIRKAEIDIRNGTAIRELDSTETLLPSPTPTPISTPTRDPDDPNAAAWDTDELPYPAEVFVTDVPAEFRRTELFIGGTIPNKALLPVAEDTGDADDSSDPAKPEQTPTPVTGTWQNIQEEPSNTNGRSLKNGTSPRRAAPGFVNILICPESGYRATANCPHREAKSFPAGTEPTEFCPIHTGQH